MSKINLPELPPAVDTVRALFRGQLDYFTAQDSYYTQDQMRAYAEQSVREALEVATQALGDMSQKEFERPGFSWPTHMAYHQAMQTILALKPSDGSGHKTAPMDISSGHKGVPRTGNVDAIDTSPFHVEQNADDRQVLCNAALEACRQVVERFGPREQEFLWRERLAIRKCRAVLEDGTS